MNGERRDTGNKPHGRKQGDALFEGVGCFLHCGEASLIKQSVRQQNNFASFGFVDGGEDVRDNILARRDCYRTCLRVEISK